MISTDNQIATGHRITLMIGVLLAAFVGVVGGSFFANQKYGGGHHTKAGEKLSFKVGQVFPNHIFLDLNEKEIDLSEEIEGKKGILIFLTTGCPHCDKEIRKWNPVYSEIKSDYSVIGISYETIDRLKENKLQENISFPLINDKNGKFTSRYGIDGFPIIIGVNEERKVMFVQIGSKLGKHVRDYLQLL